MTSAVALRRDAPTRTAPSLFDGVLGGEPTLADVVASVWEGLATHGRAACPVCGAPAMEAESRAGGAGERGGSCRVCGSRIG